MKVRDLMHGHDAPWTPDQRTRVADAMQRDLDCYELARVLSCGPCEAASLLRRVRPTLSHRHHVDGTAPVVSAPALAAGRLWGAA